MATIIARPWHVANRARADGCLYPSLRTPDVAANRLFEACFCALTGNCRNDLLTHGDHDAFSPGSPFRTGRKPVL